MTGAGLETVTSLMLLLQAMVSLEFYSDVSHLFVVALSARAYVLGICVASKINSAAAVTCVRGI